MRPIRKGGFISHFIEVDGHPDKVTIPIIQTEEQGNMSMYEITSSNGMVYRVEADSMDVTTIYDDKRQFFYVVIRKEGKALAVFEKAKQALNLTVMEIPAVPAVSPSMAVKKLSE